MPKERESPTLGKITFRVWLFYNNVLLNTTMWALLQDNICAESRYAKFPVWDASLDLLRAAMNCTELH